MSPRAAFGERLLRLALRCHPEPFRREYGDELLAYYREACRTEAHRHGPLWRIRFLGRALLAAGVEGWRQRRSPSGGATRPVPWFEPKEFRKGAPRMTGLATDLRHSIRRLFARPQGTLLAVGMLALAIGISTAMFTVVDALLLRPLPFPDVERLAHVTLRTDHTIFGNVSRPVFDAWRASGAFTAVEGAHTTTSLLDTRAGVVTAREAFVTPGLFPMLGARPVLGRLFAPDEGRVGTDQAVVLGEGVWRRVFGADPSVIGTTMRVDDRPLVVVGVLPDGFRFPAWDVELWRPFDYATQPERSTTERPAVYVRVADPAAMPSLLERAASLAHAADPETAPARADVWPIVTTNASGYLTQATRFLAGGVALVFLVLCANVSSLLLAQMSGRAREFRMCAALGASRSRLIRQALTESVVLGAAGTACGIGAAWGLVSLTRAWMPDAYLLTTLNPIDLDPRALAVASASGLAATVGAGLLPAFVGTRPDRAGASTSGIAERGGTESRAARTFSRGLLIVEIALTCALLVGTSLLVGSFVRLSGVDRGLDTEGVLTSWVRFTPAAAAAPGTADSVKRAVEALPGVARVSLSRSVPPRGGMIHFGCCWLPDAPGAEPLSMPTVDGFTVDADFFDFYRVPILRGRGFAPNEPASHVILGEALAARLWPDGDAVGRSFKYDDERFEVIGVARELRFPSINLSRDAPEYYRPAGVTGSTAWVSVRCDGPCPGAGLLRRTLQSLPEVREIYDVRRLADAYDEELARPRAAATMAVLFTGIAVLAAAGGLFSVLSYAVGRRRREFGIRASLGARPAALQRLVFGEGIRLAVAGGVLGGGAAWLVARALASVTYEVSAAEPSIWLSVALVVGLTTTAASWAPARRAARVDPAALLRE